MSTLSKLHQSAAEHHEHAARHHAKQPASRGERRSGGVDQAHMATDHQVHAIHYATQAAKEYLAAHRGS
jgi:hypothetical protein